MIHTINHPTPDVQIAEVSCSAQTNAANIIQKLVQVWTTSGMLGLPPMAVTPSIL